MATKACKHIKSAALIPATADEYQCAECVKTGDRWVHLRKCVECGVVLCCDSSPNKHATAHFHSHGHPVIVSAEPGERWAWCYIDEKMVRY
ncbi:MAG: UBP-type zinc finger domain-containing protein [Bacteroidota bacterium]